MGIYLFQHPETGEIREVYQNMNDPHVYEEDDVQWNRIFTVPQASIDTDIDPMSQKSWNEKTKNKRGTIGDMFDKSKELSEKREKIIGKDPISEKYYEDFRKKSHGNYHQDDPKRKEVNEQNMKKLGVKFE